MTSYENPQFNLYASTKQGTVFKVKVESDPVSLKGKVVAQIALDCGLLYGMAILNDELYTASHDDDVEIFTVKSLKAGHLRLLEKGQSALKYTV